ncbi:MAG: replication-associated recombination protein A, partial [Desulfobacterales bacterium]
MSDDLFEYGAMETAEAARPLAERIRPERLEDIVGQRHVMGPEGVIRRAVEADRIFSMILWGPPGCGKTTIARLIARQTKSHFVHFSAVLSGVREIRSVIAEAQEQRRLHRRRTVLFVDEIHRFNKSQQDAFLHHVESGLLTLIGATTENPSFEVIAPLLSRCRVITLEALTTDDLRRVVRRAVADPDRGLGRSNLSVDDDALDFLVGAADGDARAALNGLEIAASLLADGADAPDALLRITLPLLQQALQKKALRYDKAGEEHYNLISAFHKSLRGSDADAALYWLQRMIDAGEDPLYVARRMVRFASEDVGTADPQALTVALSAAEAFRMLGPPEGELALAQAAVYLATAPKSNRIYTAVHAIREEIERTGSLPVPLHIRNAPTRLMKDLGYGKGYRYAHDYREGYTLQRYLPEDVESTSFYT